MQPIDFSAITQRRFGGVARLYGASGAARIHDAHVAVVGIGGVGSWAVEALARSGVGALTLFDLDHIAESNINRQIHALDQTLGQAKVLAMRDRIAGINPQCKVNAVEAFVEAETWPALLPSGVTAVIDACDHVKAKTAMAAWARSSDVVFVSVGAAGGKRHAHKVDITDLCRVTHDPLLAQVRNNLRRHHGAPREGKTLGVACVFSIEPVRRPNAGAYELGQEPMSDATLNCHGYGSAVSVTATFGQCAAGWVLDKISDHSQERPQKNAII
jgi:tRNA threonylcarbamoyladenosine dehydratase